MGKKEIVIALFNWKILNNELTNAIIVMWKEQNLRSNTWFEHVITSSTYPNIFDVP